MTTTEPAERGHDDDQQHGLRVDTDDADDADGGSSE